jgi:hypothetical protein
MKKGNNKRLENKGYLKNWGIRIKGKAGNSTKRRKIPTINDINGSQIHKNAVIYIKSKKKLNLETDSKEKAVKITQTLKAFQVCLLVQDDRSMRTMVYQEEGREVIVEKWKMDEVKTPVHF